jgi:hypothetical protein
MKIVGVEGLTREQIRAEMLRGAKFVVFEYCVSVVFMTFKRASSIHLVRPGESAAAKSVPSTLCSLLLGWWGIPWGPIWTVATVARNLRGGRDVTAEMAASFATDAGHQAAPLRQAA